MSGGARARPIVFGEVLFDRFPSGEAVLGGAPFNVAWNLQAFGCTPLLISRIGSDALGERIHDAMTGWGMDTSMLQVDATHPTGSVDVRLRSGEPEYDIVADRAYDFIDAGDFDAIGDAALIYHGSLALRSRRTRESFAQLCASVVVPRFLDVNLRAPWWCTDDVVAWAEATTWLKLNESELAALGWQHDSSERAAAALRRSFGLEAIILTRGAQGAVYIAETESLAVEPARATRAIDTVGAGDAFASVILLGLLERWSIAATLRRAQEFASGVVGVRGATVADPAFYARYTDAWSHE